MIAVVDTRYSWTSRCEHSPLNILQVILQPITTRKAITRKFSLSKKKITKLQRELQSQFDTSAAVMRKFKEIKKKHDDKKITQKTNNAEAQPENEKKKTEVSQKAEPTKNIEEKAPDKTKLKDAQKQKEKKSPVQKSLDQKTTKKHQSNAKSPQKITQKKKEDKLPVLEKPVEQPKDGKNEQKTITDAKQETEPSLTKAQKKKLQMEYQKQFIQQQRAKEDIKASKPWEIDRWRHELMKQVGMKLFKYYSQLCIVPKNIKYFLLFTSFHNALKTIFVLLYHSTNMNTNLERHTVV
ncbi:Hypothetical_protein [Hexamita inflata]|uniref:Hypothetical_protein n=1 Tax=Hexamita inflata TaxID=28002 RepID=A0AA86QDU6_9EUKA|nr:Hypothetical protein HINF_LOCUS40748 [Hexamita inflata]